MNAALNRANKLVTAYLSQEAILKETLNKSITIAKNFDMTSQQLQKVTADRDRLKRGRNRWRLISAVCAIVGLAVVL